MSEENMRALRAATAENDQLRADLARAESDEEFVAIANGHGFVIEIEDLPTAGTDDELSDAELEGVSGGYTFPRPDLVYCDNPWTNYWCSLKC